MASAIYAKVNTEVIREIEKDYVFKLFIIVCGTPY